MADRAAVAHVAHDELLVAAWVSGDTDPEDAARAADLTTRCAECRDLATDLRELRSAMRTLPPATRTRDFRLTPADAERLRARPRWLGRFRGTSSAGLTRPLAGAMTAIGLAGLLLTTVPLGGDDAGASAENPETTRMQIERDTGGSAGAVGGAAVGSAAAAPAESAAAERASDGPLPVAASPGAVVGGTPVPGDVYAPGGSGADGPDVQSTTRPGVAQATAPAPSVDDGTLFSAADTPPARTDPVRPALAVASAALLAGGLILLLVTRRRRTADR